MPTTNSPTALITGASSGLGLVTARVFLQNGYRVGIVGRDQSRLDDAKISLSDAAKDPAAILAIQADLSSKAETDRVVGVFIRGFGQLDVLINCVGQSDRGLTEQLESNHLVQLFEQNVVTALLCSQSAISELEKTNGAIINIGSLASKVGARYIGGYSTVKHALAGMTQQMRMELLPKGIHVGLVSPGPIRRDDAGKRYQQSLTNDLPEQASQPGGGTKVKGLLPERVANAVLNCVKRRKPDVVLPGHMRALIALGHAFPGLGDWLLLKFTSSK